MLLPAFPFIWATGRPVFNHKTTCDLKKSELLSKKYQGTAMCCSEVVSVILQKESLTQIKVPYETETITSELCSKVIIFD